MQFKYKRNDWGYVRNEPLEFYEEWLPFYLQFCEIDLLAGKADQYQLAHKDLSRAPSEEVFYKSYNFHSTSQWNARFSKKFLRRLRESQYQLKRYIIATMGRLLDGYIFAQGTDTVYAQELSFMKFF
jgi:hypothetical protein